MMETIFQWLILMIIFLGILTVGAFLADMHDRPRLPNPKRNKR